MHIGTQRAVPMSARERPKKNGGMGMTTEATAGAVLKIGLWNGSAMCREGLLYRQLLASARANGIQGATVIAHIEGSGGAGVFRSVENEPVSNALPLWLEWVDAEERLLAWLPEVLTRIRGEGVCAMEHAQVWWKRPAGSVPRVDRTEAADAAERADQTALAARTRAGGQTGLAQHANWSTFAAIPGREVRVYTHEGVFVGGKPIYQAAAEWLRRKGVLWFATTRAAAGYGDNGALRRAGMFPFRQHAPVVITIVDTRDRVDAWLPDFQQWLGKAALVVSSEVTLYRPH
jgi:PII-like signaling protein